MKINWKVRLKKKTFWVAILSATLLFIQMIAEAFGYDLTGFGDDLTVKFNALLIFLSAIGIIDDPTTKGVSDSDQALEYDEPRK
ncbi:phage holin [Bacillus altitudinis]|uniref:phage holin n=1 Tax=Bacillus altitudinis TaxID=293387 RepID=UPI001F2BC910|nr:phage holin [Bacillus altitudinis]